MTINEMKMAQPTPMQRAWSLLGFRQRAVKWRFPQPIWAKDEVMVTTHVVLGPMDRLRTLISGRLQVNTVTYTEARPGRCETDSAIGVLPPF